MSDRAPNSVYLTDDRMAAELVAAMLNDQGIRAEVKTHLQESDGLVIAPFASSSMSNHLEVHLADLDQLEAAEQLIAANEEIVAQTAKRLTAAPPEDVVVECESCGNSSVFSGEFQGTVQSCPHCAAYVDIPGGEDEFDWSIVDETVSEYEQDEAEADEEED